MVERCRGVIVNNASSTGRFPTPLLSLYSASKAYMDFFSRFCSFNYCRIILNKFFGLDH
jgi:17beta-estradiol 17-dehydrogenase / very-long-chain 3-oxoacyl-CoA reductase